MKRTRYEELLDRRTELRHELDALREQEGEYRDRAAREVARGTSPQPPPRDFGRERQALQDALAHVEEALQDSAVVKEHVEATEAAIARQRAALDRELQPLRKKALRATEKAEEAERRLQQAKSAQMSQREILMARERELRQLSAQIEYDEPSSTKGDAERVSAFLDQLREGSLTTFVPGDPDLESAYRTYEKEVAQIAAWGASDRMSRRTSGQSVEPPACARHYSKQRLAELSRRQVKKAGLGMPADAAIRPVEPSSSPERTPRGVTVERRKIL